MSVYGYILEYKTEHDGAMPSMRQIGDACDIPSTSTVSYYIDRLERKAKLKRLDDNSLAVVGARWIPPGAAA